MQRHGLKVVVLFLDLDRFRIGNESLGDRRTFLPPF